MIQCQNKLARKMNDTHVSILNTGSVEQCLFEYAQNYKLAAEAIVNNMISSKDISILDTQFFSMSYLYRHSTELLLKAIAFQHHQDAKKRKKIVKESSHSLFSLYMQSSSLINKPKTMDQDALDWAVSFLGAIDKYDQGSDFFRYFYSIKTEKNQSGQKLFRLVKNENNQKVIDIDSFSQNWNLLIDILIAIYKKTKFAFCHNEKMNPELLIEGGDYYKQSQIYFEYNNNSFFPYIQSYCEGAKYLRSQMESQPALTENLFLPMCSLYRHGIELCLKAIIRDLSSEDDCKKAEIIKICGHTLPELFDKVSEEFIQEFANETGSFQMCKEKLEIIENIAISPSYFLYPIDKSINLLFKKEKTYELSLIDQSFNGSYEFLTIIYDIIFDGLCASDVIKA